LAGIAVLCVCSKIEGFAFDAAFRRPPGGVMSLPARPPSAFAPMALLHAPRRWRFCTRQGLGAAGPRARSASARPGSGLPLRGKSAAAVSPMQMGASGGEGDKPYTIVDGKLDHTVVMPISEETTSRMIECKITKASLFLSVGGQRIIDGEMWGEVVPADSSWEIDKYGKEDRCVVIRLRKKSKEDWPYVIRGDYDMEAADWANRRVVSRETITKQDVEGALQLIVSLLKPSGLGQAPTAPPPAEEAAPADDVLPGEQPLKKLPEVPGSAEMKKKWDQMVVEVKEEEWRDTADAMKRYMYVFACLRASKRASCVRACVCVCVYIYTYI
jgi:hypothetical protein